uniref:Uncharacterized protein n=1 Tax=Molossus molossus TaxID=27622 RepID=A0A7J8HZZ9_MOLMO|nr:hypothetical protein HJG59_010827 [Molossus molossus]
MDMFWVGCARTWWWLGLDGPHGRLDVPIPRPHPNLLQIAVYDPLMGETQKCRQPVMEVGSHKEVARLSLPVSRTVSAWPAATRSRAAHIPVSSHILDSQQVSPDSLFVFGLHTSCPKHGTLPLPTAR